MLKRTLEPEVMDSEKEAQEYNDMDHSDVNRRFVEELFAFVSDFRNAAAWDPRTYAVEKATEGPTGIGPRFMLTGG